VTSQYRRTNFKTGKLLLNLPLCQICIILSGLLAFHAPVWAQSAHWAQSAEPVSSYPMTGAPLTLAPLSDESSVERSGFAAPGQVTWTALTDFEHALIQRFDNQTSAPANDLLELYLLASGDIRSGQQAQAFQAQIDAFFVQHDDVRRIGDERERGAELLRRMHRHFLNADQRAPLAGYDADQSRLSELLRSGVYNCISSALLYLVLAEAAGLSSAGVIMPSHAYVQITLPDGHVADVETTAADGFDVLRDQAFFSRQASDWFASRRLVVPSFADYEQRSVVSAAGLGYESMWSQHTTQTRMHYADRMRLAELRGVMQADEADAQHNRLVYYYREADYLRQQNDMVLLDALMSRINPLLSDFDSREANDHFTDTVTAVPLLLLQAERAEWLFRRSVQESAQERAQESAQNSDAESTGQNVDASQQLAGQGQQLAFYVLSQADSAALNQQLIRDLSYRALGAQVTNLLEINAMSEARSLIAQFPDDCADSAFCISALEQFYMSQGQQYWAQRDWPSAIFIYEEYLARGLQTNNRQVFENNLQSAYLNQAEQHWFDEERDEAIAMLEVCVITVAAPQRCQQRLQAARQGR
jgi:hypothetical protein